MGRNKSLLLLSALSLVFFAGCAEEGQGDAPEDVLGAEPDAVNASETTGGIRGVVIDQTIVPIKGATVTVEGEGLKAVTTETGTFTFSDLVPGTYFVTASHPLYNEVQQGVEVVANVAEPPIVKLQLERVVLEDPYHLTQMFEGYIFCSLNIVIFLSEECGEGVGVPGMGRVGGHPDNHAEIQFYIDNLNAKSILVEQVWEPSLSVGVGGNGDFYTPVALQWSCDPVCGGDRLVTGQGGSPLSIRVPDDTVADRIDSGKMNLEEPISTFTWASPSETGALVEQSFEEFVTISYFLPLPEEWSYVNESPEPF